MNLANETLTRIYTSGFTFTNTALSQTITQTQDALSQTVTQTQNTLSQSALFRDTDM